MEENEEILERFSFVTGFRQAQRIWCIAIKFALVMQIAARQYMFLIAVF